MLRLQTRCKRAKVTKAQVALEFVLLIGIVMMVFFVFEIFVREHLSDMQSDTDYYQLKDIALSVQTELNKAVTLEDGYHRTFEIPTNLDGDEYNITQVGDFLMFSTAESEYSVTVPAFTGMVVKGDNQITKTDGELEVNP